MVGSAEACQDEADPPREVYRPSGVCTFTGAHRYADAPLSNAPRLPHRWPVVWCTLAELLLRCGSRCPPSSVDSVR